MASGGAEELEKPPASFKSHVWEHFGFPVKINDDGRRVVDKTVTVCRHCATRKPYENGNTSSMATHLTRHHPGVSVTGAKRKDAQQQLLTAAFKQPFAAESDRAKAITKSIGMFIAADMRPYSVVENKGFKNMVKVLEPRYEIPSRTHFSMKIVPDLYEQEKIKNCRRIIQGILCCPHHRRVDLQGNGKLRDCDCSLHHSGVGDAKSGATDTPPL